jgi:outer membrane protein assembly factor BamB
MYCLNAETGAVVWSQEIKTYLAQLGVTLPSEQAARGGCCMGPAAPALGPAPVLAIHPLHTITPTPPTPPPPSANPPASSAPPARPPPAPAPAANLAVFPILSRTSPVVHGANVIIGTMQRSYGGHAYFLALDRATGALAWGAQADPHMAAVVTLSPTLHEGVLFTGTSSLEENVATRERPARELCCHSASWQALCCRCHCPAAYRLLCLARSDIEPCRIPTPNSHPRRLPSSGQAYECCTFRGSVLALDAASGKVLWRRYTTPDNGGRPGGWSGSAVWGSSPVIDRARQQVVVSTGDNYG